MFFARREEGVGSHLTLLGLFLDSSRTILGVFLPSSLQLIQVVAGIHTLSER